MALGVQGTTPPLTLQYLWTTTGTIYLASVAVIYRWSTADELRQGARSDINAGQA